MLMTQGMPDVPCSVTQLEVAYEPILTKDEEQLIDAAADVTEKEWHQFRLGLITKAGPASRR